MTTSASSPGGSFRAKAPWRLGSIEYFSPAEGPSSSNPLKDWQPGKLPSETPLDLYLRLKGWASGSFVLIRAAAWSNPYSIVLWADRHWKNKGIAEKIATFETYSSSVMDFNTLTEIQNCNQQWRRWIIRTIHDMCGFLLAFIRTDINCRPDCDWCWLEPNVWFANHLSIVSL